MHDLLLPLLLPTSLQPIEIEILYLLGVESSKSYISCK